MNIKLRATQLALESHLQVTDVEVAFMTDLNDTIILTGFELFFSWNTSSSPDCCLYLSEFGY